MNRELITEPVETVREIIGNNRRAAYFVAAGALILQVTGRMPTVKIPSYWPVVLVTIGGAVLAGRWGARKIDDLIPEPDGIIIVEFDASEGAGGAIYELSEDAFANMRVLGGDLFQWDRSGRRVYEVRHYDPTHNVAMANWRESKPGSALASHPTVDDVLSAIDEFRKTLEPDVAEAREVKRRARGTVRELDKERAEAQQEVLDDHLAPDIGDSRTVSEVFDEQMPNDLHPEMVSAEDALKNGHADDSDDESEGDDEDRPNADDVSYKDALGVFS